MTGLMLGAITATMVTVCTVIVVVIGYLIDRSAATHDLQRSK